MKKTPTPPRLAERFLQWAIRPELAEEALGDLEEKFSQMLASHSPARARLNYWFQVTNYLRPFALDIRLPSPFYHISMFRHNLILALRNFNKHRSQFLINTIGLTAGLSCVLMIYLWVADEYSVDRFHQQDEQLFQVMSNHSDASGVRTLKGVPGLLLEEIQTSVPAVSHAVAMTDVQQFSLSVDKSFSKARGKFASADFFNVFSFPIIEGDRNLALVDKSGILISKSLAYRLFNSVEVIGKTVSWHFYGMTNTVQVNAVFEDVPDNASESFDFLLSWDYYHDDLIDFKNWGNYYGRIVVAMNPDANTEASAAQIDAIFQEHQTGGKVELFMAKFSDRYLFGEYENGVQTGGQIEYVQLFSIIALFILLIACINFINLSTARAAYRMKEIGAKKAMGASRRSLALQYYTESILITIGALIVAFFLVKLSLPQFNLIADKSLTLTLDKPLLFATTALLFIVGILAGSYPALYLSGFTPVQILSGKFKKQVTELWVRKGLVVVQFSISILLIVAVLAVYQQMSFIRTKNLGYEKDNLVYFERSGELQENSEAFISELKNQPGILDAAVSGFMVGGSNATGGVGWDGKTEADQVQFWEIPSGYGMIELMGMEMLEGRAFSPEFGADSFGIIVNEAAIAAMGMEDPVGKVIRHYTGEKTIIGVVKDFHLVSFHQTVEPMLFLFQPAQAPFIMARLKAGEEATGIAGLKALHQSFNPGYLFEPSFIDEAYEALYISEERVSVLSRYFAGLAILISCLGLLGLAAYTVERRVKEIGIRKVLGASEWKVVQLISGEFTVMVLIAILIALPLSYWASQSWLEGFAYQVSLPWWLYASSGFIALIIAWAVVGSQSLKAAMANPVTALRGE